MNVNFDFFFSVIEFTSVDQCKSYRTGNWDDEYKPGLYCCKTNTTYKHGLFLFYL